MPLIAYSSWTAHANAPVYPFWLLVWMILICTGVFCLGFSIASHPIQIERSTVHVLNRKWLFWCLVLEMFIVLRKGIGTWVCYIQCSKMATWQCCPLRPADGEPSSFSKLPPNIMNPGTKSNVELFSAFFLPAIFFFCLFFFVIIVTVFFCSFSVLVLTCMWSKKIYKRKLIFVNMFLQV